MFIGTIESVENMRNVGWRNAKALVCDYNAAVAFLLKEADVYRFVGKAVFLCIVDKVVKHLL